MNETFEEVELDCPRCNAKFVPESIAQCYVCPKCGAFMPRYEAYDDRECSRCGANICEDCRFLETAHCENCQANICDKCLHG